VVIGVLIRQNMGMAKNVLMNFREKIFGDKRNQYQALRDAGFSDVSDAVIWGHSVVQQPVDASTQLINLRAIRQAKPELTLQTATFILNQMQQRHH